MRSVSTKDLELKLQLTPQQLQRLGAHPALDDLTVGKPLTCTLRSIYFDTPDHRLREKGISLRLRSIGDQWLQTIKSVNGLNDRAADDDPAIIVSRPEPDVGAIKNDKIRRAIERTLKASTLEAQFETVFTRTTRKLHSDNGDLELALDEGVVRAGNIENQLCEAELELKSGSPNCLLETAATLFSTEPMRLAESSKVERGYNLVLGRPNARFAPQRARHVALRGKETCADALRLFVDSATEQISLNRRAVLDTDDPEAVHQLRIGLRRLRSALRAFRPLNDGPGAQELEQYARDLGRSVGKLRNADTFIEHIYAPVAGEMKGERGFDELRTALVAHRSAMRHEARDALSGDQWSRLHVYLVLWPQTIDGMAALRTGVSDFADLALKKGWKKIAKHGDNISGLAPEQRHDMRKALKGFRYTTEFFGDLYDRKTVEKFVKGMRQLQDVFGYVNDVATAKELNRICHELCGESREAQRAAGYVLGWHDINARHAWNEVPLLWRHLKKRAHFWK